MAKFKIKIPIRHFQREKAECLCDYFSGATVSWRFCQKDTSFFASTEIKERLGERYRHEIMGIQKLLKIMPDSESLKRDLDVYQKRANNDKIYDITLSFEGEIAAEIDISHNAILHYTGPIPHEMTHRDVSKLKKLIVSDCLDEFYEEEIKKFLLCLMMSMTLAAPEMDYGCGILELYIDNQKYKNEMFLESPLHTEAFSKYSAIMKTKLSFCQAFSWVKMYTKLQDNDQKPPIPFTMLTYLFNRDSHESLLYSVIGLENLYSATNGGISYTLQKRINYLFPSITKEQIKNIYTQRSNFVHGKVQMGMCKDYSDNLNGILQFDDEAVLACALLIETLRILIANNATKISFNEYLSHKFI